MSANQPEPRMDPTAVETAEIERPAPAAAPRCRSTGKSILLCASILLCGIVIGAAGALLAAGHVIRTVLQHPEKVPDHVARRMTSRLELTDSQQRRVQAILHRHFAALMAIRAETRPRVRAELTEMRDDVAAVLHDNQHRTWLRHFAHVERLFGKLEGQAHRGLPQKQETERARPAP